VLAALAVHDPARRPEDDVIAMAEAAAAMRFGRVDVATGAGLTTIGECRAGDVLGLVEGDVVEIGTSEVDVTCALLDRLLGVGGELLTVVVAGVEGGPIESAVRKAVGARAPFVELVIYPDEHLDCVALLGME
jgi:dihydroxyacetone kinase-like predicted kinase